MLLERSGQERSGQERSSLAIKTNLNFILLLEVVPAKIISVNRPNGATTELGECK